MIKLRKGIGEEIVFVHPVDIGCGIEGEVARYEVVLTSRSERFCVSRISTYGVVYSKDCKGATELKSYSNPYLLHRHTPVSLLCSAYYASSISYASYMNSSNFRLFLRWPDASVKRCS